MDPNDAVQKALEAAKARSLRMNAAVSNQHPSLPAQKVNRNAGGVWNGLGVFHVAGNCKQPFYNYYVDLGGIGLVLGSSWHIFHFSPL